MAAENILLVEDCSANRLLYKTLLSKAGYTLQLASSVEEAEAAIRDAKAPFDCIISDMCLPDPRGGLDVLRIAHKRDLGTPVIILTGLPNHDEIHEALENGAFSYGVKGEAGEHARLLNTVKRALDHASLRRFYSAVNAGVEAAGTDSIFEELDTLQKDYDALLAQAAKTGKRLRAIRQLRQGRKPRRPRK
jgi:two-component system chemotaxis response regulator CheY